ncbi:hypothetical protein AAG612_03255 [Citromicrobium bathyomarinum]|uniref:hypothetical protein n=1 Tax=Citromicrobium bathyomarinum TaxID=72174 RepID=UPI00315B36CE
MIRTLACCSLVLALAACSGEPEDADATPSPTASATTDAPSDPRTLVAADFGELELGAKIEGPVGPEVEASIIVDGRSIGDIVSYVACPAEYDECDPEDMPEGTVYTYVHTVRPGVDDPNDPPFMRPVGLDEVEAATLFETVREARGFTGAIGFDRKQVEEALGPDGTIRVQDDNGALAWRIVGGDGWSTGEPITFFWQSTMAPTGPAEAFALRADQKIAMASGPFPGEEDDEP